MQKEQTKNKHLSIFPHLTLILLSQQALNIQIFQDQKISGRPLYDSSLFVDEEAQMKIEEFTRERKTSVETEREMWRKQATQQQ